MQDRGILGTDPAKKRVVPPKGSKIWAAFYASTNWVTLAWVQMIRE